jgi:hypothetical protein
MGTADKPAMAAPATQMSAGKKIRIFATDENPMDTDKTEEVAGCEL